MSIIKKPNILLFFLKIWCYTFYGKIFNKGKENGYIFKYIIFNYRYGTFD